MKTFKFLSFIFFELLMLVLIFSFGYMIYDLKFNRIKGIQITQLNKNELITEPDEEFKYFFEPKPNTVNYWSPEWLGYSVENKINSDSLNDERDYSVIKPSDTYRILTVGDSFTYGLYVATKNNFSKKLEAKLNDSLICDKYSKFEVINLGVGGYDVSYTYKRFILRGIKYNPDLVIWLINPHNIYSYNDLIIPIQNILLSAGIQDFNPNTRQYIAIEEARNKINQTYGSNYMTELSKQKLFKYKEFIKVLTLFLSLDDLPQNQQKIMNEIISNSNFIYQSMKLSFLQNTSFHFIDYHPNELGHEVLANGIYKIIVNSYFSNCNNKQ